MNDAQAELETFIDKFTPHVAALTRALLAKARDRIPGATILVYDNYNALAIGFGPSEKAGEAILSLAVMPRWVTLCFLWGATLSDPHKILKGDGSRVRNVRLHEPEAFDDPKIGLIAGRPAPTGRPAAGQTLIIKSISAGSSPGDQRMMAFARIAIWPLARRDGLGAQPNPGNRAGRGSEIIVRGERNSGRALRAGGHAGRPRTLSRWNGHIAPRFSRLDPEPRRVHRQPDQYDGPAAAFRSLAAIAPATVVVTAEGMNSRRCWPTATWLFSDPDAGMASPAKSHGWCSPPCACGRAHAGNSEGGRDMTGYADLFGIRLTYRRENAGISFAIVDA